MKILRNSSVLQSHLSSIVSKLRSSTTLIVSSAPAAHRAKDAGPQKIDQELKRLHSGIENQISQCKFVVSMQFNLKTISYGSSTLSAAYPTENDLDAALELMKRTGAINVIGVGSGPAMDLAKASYYKNCEVTDVSDGDESHLILNPGTLGATLTAASKDCLTLSQKEEALLPYYSRPRQTNATTILLDEKMISVPTWCSSNDTLQLRSHRGHNATITDAALAGLVIALDAAKAFGDISSDEVEVQEQFRRLLVDCVRNSLDCINTMNEYGMDDPNGRNVAIEASKKHAIGSMLNAGQLLSFGRDNSLPRRNISVAMSSSLLPKYFPFGNWISFTASLLPGVCRAIAESDGADDNALLSSIAGMITGGNQKQNSLSSLVEWADEISHTNESSIIVPSLSALAEGAPDPNELLTHVEDNGAFLNCEDADSSYIETLLIASLNR